ncbi:cation:proton antiporter, partial [Salmonella enterica subsp. enterica serovar Cerro]|nr:cation:proton antiporter [Salmonella enterica subsp. enterica serovar Cerro]
ESYVHRIGRTGRAGRAGRALLFVENRERRLLRNIERTMKLTIHEFLEHGREIFGLALALVLVTVVGIGFLIYWLVPGIPLIPAFA